MSTNAYEYIVPYHGTPLDELYDRFLFEALKQLPDVDYKYLRFNPYGGITILVVTHGNYRYLAVWKYEQDFSKNQFGLFNLLGYTPRGYCQLGTSLTRIHLYRKQIVKD